MKHFCASAIFLTLLVLLVTSNDCPLKKKKLNKKIKKYNKKCLQKGFQSSLGCESVDGKLKKKALKRCGKLEQVLKKCGHSCPTDGDWSDFGNWSDCSAACGGGSQKRTRSCSNPTPANGGSNCVGDAEESKECNDQPCEPYLLNVFCDDQKTVYIDGVQKYQDKQYRVMASLSVPASSSVIAVRCHNSGGGYALVANMWDTKRNVVMVTDNSWRCSRVEESGWENPDFVEGDNWKLPDTNDEHLGWIRANFGVTMEGLSIWAKSRVKNEFTPTSYCRKILN